MKKYKPYMYFSNHLMSGIAGFGFAKKTKKPPNGWFLLIFGGPERSYTLHEVCKRIQIVILIFQIRLFETSRLLLKV